MAYTKLFNSIVTSTIWLETDRTRIVWITMLALADANGEVQASVPGLAHVAGVPVEDCRAALDKFLSPDLDSRTKDDEGRRIEPIDGGWHLLNHAKYRAMASGDDRNAKAAERQRRHREKTKRNVTVTPCHASVTVSNAPSHTPSHAEAEAEAEADSEKPNTERRVTAARAVFIPPTESEWMEHAQSKFPNWPRPQVLSAFNHYVGNGWRSGKNPVKIWRGCLATCYHRWEAENTKPINSDFAALMAKAKLNCAPE